MTPSAAAVAAVPAVHDPAGAGTALVADPDPRFVAALALGLAQSETRRAEAVAELAAGATRATLRAASTYLQDAGHTPAVIVAEARVLLDAAASLLRHVRLAPAADAFG